MKIEKIEYEIEDEDERNENYYKIKFTYNNEVPFVCSIIRCIKDVFEALKCTWVQAKIDVLKVRYISFFDGRVV